MNPERENVTVGETKRGNDPYGDSDFAKAPVLQTKTTGGVVGQPSVGGDYAFVGIQKTASVDGPHGEVETTYDHANLSKKFKYPQVSQDVPAKGENQFTGNN